MKLKKLLFYLILLILIISCEKTPTVVENTVVGCMDTLACNYDASANISDINSCLFEIDVCGICGGNSESTETCFSKLNIYYNSSIPLSGFQFDITGVSILSSSGGLAEASGFSVSSSDKRVLGFSLSGATIAIGEGILTILEVTGNIQSACLSNIILSDSSGNSPYFILENCSQIVIP